MQPTMIFSMCNLFKILISFKRSQIMSHQTIQANQRVNNKRYLQQYQEWLLIQEQIEENLPKKHSLSPNKSILITRSERLQNGQKRERKITQTTNNSIRHRKLEKLLSRSKSKRSYSKNWKQVLILKAKQVEDCWLKLLNSKNKTKLRYWIPINLFPLIS